MRLIIVGGDKVSFHLVNLLEGKDIDITVIETRIEVCRHLADQTEVTVFHGDGTNRDVLKQAGCAEADMLIALTGKDENNLIACQLAKHDFAVKSTLAKLNNPKNREAFNIYGVDRIYSSTEILADIIDWDIEYEGMRVAYSIPGNSKYMIELNLSENSPAVGRTLADYQFPVDITVALITRYDTGEIVVPTGHVVMQAGDHMHLVCDKDDFDHIWETMVK